MNEKQKEGMIRFNPDCPKCKKKMVETITGRFKCDHCQTQKDVGYEVKLYNGKYI